MDISSAITLPIYTRLVICNWWCTYSCIYIYLCVATPCVFLSICQYQRVAKLVIFACPLGRCYYYRCCFIAICLRQRLLVLLDYFSITLTKCLIYHSLHCHASIQYHRHCHTSGNWSAVVLTFSFWLANEPRAIVQLLSLVMRIGIRQRLMLNEFLIRWMQELAVLINNLNNSQWQQQQQQPKPSQQ